MLTAFTAFTPSLGKYLVLLLFVYDNVSNTRARVLGSSSLAVVTLRKCIPFGTVLFLDVDNVTVFVGSRVHG